MGGGHGKQVQTVRNAMTCQEPASCLLSRNVGPTGRQAGAKAGPTVRGPFPTCALARQGSQGPTARSTVDFGRCGGPGHRAGEADALSRSGCAPTNRHPRPQEMLQRPEVTRGLLRPSCAPLAIEVDRSQARSARWQGMTALAQPGFEGWDLRGSPMSGRIHGIVGIPCRTIGSGLPVV